MPEIRIAFSRSAQPSLFGKRTVDVRSKVAPETADALERLWRSLNFQTESEFLAQLIETRVHGVDHVMTVHRQRVLAVAGKGNERETAHVER